MKHIYTAERKRTTTQPNKGPLIVSGFFDESLGIGRGGHCSLDAFQRAGLNPIRHDLRPLLNTQTPFQHPLPGNSDGGVHFIHCNAPELLAFIRALDPKANAHCYRIGYWAYELSQVPETWVDMSRYLHEVWVPSQFVKEALSGAFCPIKVMPHDVLASLSMVSPSDKVFETVGNQFSILVAGDLRSSAERKNILGSLEIFFEAFPEESSEVKLIVKLSNVEVDANVFKVIDSIASTRSDVIVIVDEMSYAEVIGLIKGCDLVLSAHRSEGFGLMLAEAIALNKTVLATGWSGNLEFMSEVPEALLAYELVPVQDASGIYVGGDRQVWADVNIKDAAKRLRSVVDQTIEIDFSPAHIALSKISQKWSRNALKEAEFINFVNA